MRTRYAFGRFLVFGAALLAVLAFVGCSESVAPDDEVTVTEEDVAYQSGYVAYAMVEVIPVLQGRAATPGEETLPPPFGGSFWYDPGPPKHAYTDAGHFLTLDIDDDDVADVTFTFDVTGVGTDPITANGTGILTAGDLVISFTVIDVVVPSGGWPISGTIVILSSGHEATVTFTPGLATVVIGELEFTVDLSDGTITPL